MEKLPWQNFLEEILKEKWSWCIYLAHIDCPWLLLDCFDVVALWNVRFHIFPYQHRVRIPDGSISMSDHKRGSDLFFSSKFTFWQGRWHFQCIGHCGHLHWGSQKSLRTTPGWRTWAPRVPPKIWTQQTVSYGTKITKTVTNWFVNMDDWVVTFLPSLNLTHCAMTRTFFPALTRTTLLCLGRKWFKLWLWRSDDDEIRLWKYGNMMIVRHLLRLGDERVDAPRVR